MKRILIVYHSQEQGNTRRLAELVAEGCRQVKGVEVELANTNEARVSPAAAERADAYAMGSGDYFNYMAGGLKQFFDDLFIAGWNKRAVTSKPYVAFVTHGGGGNAVRSIESLASELKLRKVAESVTCSGAPAGDTVEAARALGRSLAEAVVE